MPYCGKRFWDPSGTYFLFADFVHFYTHWTYMYMLIFRRIFFCKYWWQKSDISSQASYRYPILWEAFFDPSDSYFLFADLVGFYTHWTYMREYHKWALAHSSSCCFIGSVILSYRLIIFSIIIQISLKILNISLWDQRENLWITNNRKYKITDTCTCIRVQEYISV